jgi:hypothetical protein
VQKTKAKDYTEKLGVDGGMTLNWVLDDNLLLLGPDRDILI